MPRRQLLNKYDTSPRRESRTALSHVSLLRNYYPECVMRRHNIVRYIVPHVHVWVDWTTSATRAKAKWVRQCGSEGFLQVQSENGMSEAVWSRTQEMGFEMPRSRPSTRRSSLKCFNKEKNSICPGHTLRKQLWTIQFESRYGSRKEIEVLTSTY